MQRPGFQDFACRSAATSSPGGFRVKLARRVTASATVTMSLTRRGLRNTGPPAVLRAGGRRRDGTSESRQQPQTLPAAPFSRAADRRTRLGQVPSDWDDCYPEAVTESDLNLNLNRANYHWHHDAAAMTVIRAVPPCPAPPPLSGAPAARGSECCHRKPECPPGPAAATQGSHSFRDSRSRS